MQYLFILGCPRSGTTVTARLLGSHPAIVLGIERYAKLFFKHGLEPALFEKDRFFDIRPGDAIYQDFSFKGYTADAATLRQRYDQARYVGDKIPGLYRQPEALARFPKTETLVIATLRNIWDVCLSYQARFYSTGKNKWDKTALQGVQDWNRSLRGIAAIQAAGYRLIIADYDRLHTPLQSEEDYRDNLAALLQTLGLAWHEQIASQAACEWSRVADLEKIRLQASLPLDVRLAICRDADFEAYRRLLKSA
ncbi:Sulfotransferase family protein [Methylomagnum ishizawai]|uniref:Sulfotransferase family protein n=1 Tax=Methylomagnum ishizawai TaxID=1760988 RepID=A0A1Y6D3F3_9GAMM|nr:sulfotransferase [Methylomagnum ishizawai]SMF97478.1 Sulfotransferase family protein [Methylomagnum ishizawai]